MSCSENTTSCGCENNPCGCKISSNDVSYQGPELSCTGILPCDTLTEAIVKIDNFVCSPEMVQVIISNIESNISLYNQFVTIVNQSLDCQTVWDCLATTTTTTTAAGLGLCYNVQALGKIDLYWLDSFGVPQFITLVNSSIDICALEDSIATGNSGTPVITGGINSCSFDGQCTTTTTTTILL